MENSQEKPPWQDRRFKKQKIIFYGPVKDLEGYVPPDWWKKLFGAFYLKTDGDVVDDPEVTKKEVDLIIEFLQLQPHHTILDLCCGHGRHSLELARRGFKRIEGLDRSRYLVNRAKSQAKKEGLLVKFREGDARKLPYQPDSFDFVIIMGNSFGYFEEPHEDLKVLKEVFRVLKPWGKVLIDVTDGEYLKSSYQPYTWEWIDKKNIVLRQRTLSIDGQRLISREIFIHTEKGVIRDQFYAERLYSEDSLKKLLDLAGFKNITFHGKISPDSKRGQDLGMMEKRILVSATAKKEWSKPIKREKTKVKNVVVVLGDPKKPDPLKPFMIFDDDDFYTIDKLKEALRTLSGYNFIYLNNHDTLIQDLIKLKPKVDYVFNLCDEGFYNDPTKELHIPALLEILQIPYTGAGPQCIAYCYDKSLVRGIAREMGIPVAPGLLIKPGENIYDLSISFPLIVKPNFGDASFGITSKSVVENFEQLITALNEIKSKFGPDKPILVEKFLPGKDLTFGIIGNPPDFYITLPILEEDYSALPEELPKICGYEAKWIPNSPYWKIKSVPVNLPRDLENIIIENSLKLFERLGCKDYARFDWRLDENGIPHLLEVNPNPGWCWDGHLAKMAYYAGYSYAEMLETILKACEVRIGLTSIENE